MSSPALFWVGGASTAGKTTILSLLSRWLPLQDYAVFDFDSLDINAAGSAAERRRAIRFWLRMINRMAKEDRSTVIVGAIFPSEIKRNDELLHGLPTHYCLLDMDNATIAQRMRARFRHPQEGPKWRQNVGLSLQDSIAMNMRMAKKYRSECKPYRCKRFNTSRTTAKQTCGKVLAWIHSH